MQDLPDLLWHAGSLVVACRIEFPDRGSNSGTWPWKQSLSHWTTREVLRPIALKSTYALTTAKFYPQTILFIFSLKPSTPMVFCISIKTYSILPVAEAKTFGVLPIYSLPLLSYHIYSISNSCWLCLKINAESNHFSSPLPLFQPRPPSLLAQTMTVISN